VTISQIPGAVRLRRNQFGIQTVLNTAVAATRRVPWRGGITIPDPWVDPDADFGSLDPVAAPVRGIILPVSTKTGALYYNDLPIRLLAGLKGGVSPTGTTAKTWDFQVASLTSDVFDIFTNETGDDTEATDTTVGIGGVINQLEDTYPQDLGAVTINDNWVYSSATIGSNGTDSLSVDSTAVPVLYAAPVHNMDTAAGSIGTTPISAAVHGLVVRVNNNLDIKHFANGSNSSNQAGGYGRGARVIEMIFTVAKTTAMVTEANTRLTDPKPARYFDVIVPSASLAQTGIPYSDRHRGAFRLFDVSETEIGGNVAFVLTYRAFYDSGLGYSYRRTVINTQATAAAA
jgi:hypothetical protein